ncbi:hypothetical protein [Brevibacterium oceani]|uniref:hypothetical protein n=1 Tax=Brevibacterium oceani TaxID=358099 RepID=UPI0015E7012F|nr:hypothetical protein [Brevibacterium oceani]
MSQDQDKDAEKRTTRTIWGVERPSLPKFEVKRRRVDAEDLQEKFEAWDAARRERRAERTPEDSARSIRRWIAAALGAGVVATVAVSSVLLGDFDAEHASNESRISQLEQQVVGAEADAIPADADLAGLITSLTKAASTDAEEVAVAQQAFAGLNRKATTAKMPDDGTPSHEMLDVVEHRKELADYFAEESFVAEDDEAYQWTTAPQFDPTIEIDPRYAWYVRYDGGVAADPDAYAWSVSTVMPILDDEEGAPTRASVVWLCRDTDTDEVLAWASATYVLDEGSEDSGAFQDLEVAVTAQGATQQRPQEKTETTVPELDGEDEDR